MRFVFEQSAEPHELFLPGCLDEAVGKEIPIRGPDGATVGTGTLVGYEVAEGGGSMRLMVDVEEEGAGERVSALIGTAIDISVGSVNGGFVARAKPPSAPTPDREGDGLLVRAARLGERLIRTAIDLATRLRP